MFVDEALYFVRGVYVLASDNEDSWETTRLGGATLCLASRNHSCLPTRHWVDDNDMICHFGLDQLPSTLDFTTGTLFTENESLEEDPHYASFPPSPSSDPIDGGDVDPASDPESL